MRDKCVRKEFVEFVVDNFDKIEKENEEKKKEENERMKIVKENDDEKLKEYEEMLKEKEILLDELEKNLI